MGKKWKNKFLMVFPPGKAHRPGIYQNTGHTLSSPTQGSLIWVKPHLGLSPTQTLYTAEMLYSKDNYHNAIEARLPT
jgi:hypothetical protein